MVDAGASKLAKLVFCLPFHPLFEIGAVFFLACAFRIAQTFTRGRNNHFRQRLQLAVGRRHHRPDGQSRSGQFFRRKGLIVVVHDVNVSLERHPRFENGSFGTAELEFELGADDARLDETPTRFAHEIIVHRRRDSDDPACQASRPPWRSSGHLSRPRRKIREPVQPETGRMNEIPCAAN
jgi:hypothetical protein